MRILIVDDNQVMRNIVKRSLHQGFDNLQIIEAFDGKDALEKFKSAELDLILSDWNMPNLDGLALLKAIRMENPDVLFGFITAQNSSTLRKSAKIYGAHFLLSKPFAPEMLTAKIQELL